MKKSVLLPLVCAFFLSAFLAGCVPKKAASSRAAIDQSAALKSVDQKVKYLTAQANAFYNCLRYQDAVELSQYILTDLQSNSREAKEMLEKAKAAMRDNARKAADEVQNSLKGL